MSAIKTKTWFVLPPVMAYYYQQKNADYKPLPVFRNDCVSSQENIMEFVFPTKNHTKISLTKGVDNQLNPIVLKATHATANATVYWYLNNKFIGSTTQYHEKEMLPKKGIYTVLIIDDFGNETKKMIEVL